MRYFIADFHIHSKYSRATSREMDIENLTRWAKLKGISLLGTGDFTHPQWAVELKGKLSQVEYGLYEYNGIYFILTTEVSNIYFKTGRTRKVHNIIFAPTFKEVDEINYYLKSYGNLAADGRPILELSCEEMVRELTNINPDIYIVPGHIWTPHFSLFGANSGFDNIQDCFGEQTKRIPALETGLSSDPAMNFRWSKLDRFSLISNSDSHSPSRIGREANVFIRRFSYRELFGILKNKDKERFLFTIEYFPEEGKYHWDGHRNCNARLSPSEARQNNSLCPVCGRKVTVGVMHRLEELADRKEGFTLPSGIPYKNLVPLDQIIAEAVGLSPESVAVQREYNSLINRLGCEFDILLWIPEEDIKKGCSSKIARGILKIRKGEVEVLPGYDGEYGKVNIFSKEDEDTEKQLTFF